MNVGLFQLLPRPEGLRDQDVIDQALREADLAEPSGFDSIWIAEHHVSSFGLVSAPSVYASALAARTSRIGIGYGVAVVPLHDPLRLAEEIAWVDQLSRGRVLVGVGPGFSPHELGAFGVPLSERHERLEEGIAILRAALAGEPFAHEGAFWSYPTVTLSPRPYRGVPPPVLRASSSPESLRRAAAEGTPPLLGPAPIEGIRERIALYRRMREELGATRAEIDRDVAEIRVLRRVHVARRDDEARTAARRALAWENETAARVHGGDPARPEPASGPIPGACVGSPETVARELLDLEELGVHHVLVWMSFGDLPYASVLRSMELMSREVLPRVQAEEWRCAVAEKR